MPRRIGKDQMLAPILDRYELDVPLRRVVCVECNSNKGMPTGVFNRSWVYEGILIERGGLLSSHGKFIGLNFSGHDFQNCSNLKAEIAPRSVWNSI
jgi:hypothetical protein